MDSPTARDRPLFLRWVLINLLVLAMLVVGGAVYGQRVHGASLLAVPVILALFVGSSCYGGYLSWCTDNLFHRYRYTRHLEAKRPHILHQAEFLTFSAWVCQILGIMSTLVGFWVLLSGEATASDLGSRIQSGAGVALLGSFIGVFASLVLSLEHRLLEHTLKSP